MKLYNAGKFGTLQGGQVVHIYGPRQTGKTHALTDIARVVLENNPIEGKVVLASRLMSHAYRDQLHQIAKNQNVELAVHGGRFFEGLAPMRDEIEEAEIVILDDIESFLPLSLRSYSLVSAAIQRVVPNALVIITETIAVVKSIEVTVSSKLKLD